MTKKRNPNAAVSATIADRKLPPYLEIKPGSKARCCGCDIRTGPPPKCDCFCHEPARFMYRGADR